MNLNQLFAALMTVILFSSCNAPQKTEDGQKSTADSTLLLGETDTRLIGKFKTINGFPYVADTTLMFHMETCDSLGTREVKQLASRQAGSHSTWDESSEDYMMQEFYRIDSIKASGNYATWCDSLEPGMTKSANAYAIGKIIVDDTTQLLLWGLITSSYEACPVTTVQNVYVSILKADVVMETFKLSEYISSVDPPVAMERIVTGIINKDLTVEMNMREENDEDMDLPELTVTRASYCFSIKDGRVTKISEKKEAPVKVKRKTPVTS